MAQTYDMTKFVGCDFSDIQGIVKPIIAVLPAVCEDKIAFQNLVISLTVNGGRDIAAAEISADSEHSATIGTSGRGIDILRDGRGTDLAKGITKGDRIYPIVGEPGGGCCPAILELEAGAGHIGPCAQSRLDSRSRP
jgi:hypothetical protein